MAVMETASNEAPKETFGDRLMDAAMAMGAPKQQEKLSKWFKKEHKITISGPMISRYKKDELPRMDQCRQYSLALGVCVEWLLTSRGSRFPEDGPMTITERRVLSMWRTWVPAVKKYVFGPHYLQ